MNNKNLIWIDKLLGSLLLPLALLFRFINRRRWRNNKNNNSILIIKFLGAGNLVSICDQSTRDFDIITAKSNEATCHKYAIGHQYYFIDEKNPLRLAIDSINIIKLLIFKRYERVINLETESFFAKFLACIPVTNHICGATNIHKGIFDSYIYDHYLVNPQLISKANLLKLLIQFQEFENRDISTLVNFKQDEFLKTYCSVLPKTTNIILAPTCSQTDPLRRLSIKQWEDILCALPTHLTFTALFANPVDIQYNEFLYLSERIPNLSIKVTSYDELVSLITQGDCLITVDSQALHIAQFAHTPTIAIYGPTSPFGVALETSTFPISRSLACSPCTHKYFKLPCQGQAPCMKFDNIPQTIAQLFENR